MAEKTENKGIVIPKNDIVKLSGALGEVLYGEMTAEGAMQLMKATVSLQKASDDVDKEQKSIINGFRTDEYKELSEKVNSKKATESEKERFEELNRVAVPKSNEMLEKLYGEVVEFDFKLLSEDDFAKLREANKSKITNGGFVTIYKYLCQKD